MSDETLKRKITFDNKEDSTILNSDSKFVLTASNVNEIKEVVNNLSDEVDRRLRFNQVFKYSKFNVPSTLKDGCNYSFELELSENEDFSDSVVLSLINDFSKFYIFENEIWNSFPSRRLISSDDKNKSIKIDLSLIISDTFKPYFGRCRWKNESTLEYQEYQGFSLGIFEYNDKEFDDMYIKEFYIVGESNIKEKEKYNYNAFYKTINGETYNVTKSTKFSSLTNLCSFNKNELIAPISHTIKNDIIKAEYTFNSITYTTYINVIINPVLLEKLEVIENINTLYQNETKSFTINAKYSDGSLKDVTNECDKILTMNNCSLTENVLHGSGCSDEFGTLVIHYEDDDFEEENISLVKYINFKVKKIKSINVSLPEIITGNETFDQLKYTAEITFDDNTKKDVTNEAIINFLNYNNEISCKNGIITIHETLLTSNKNLVGIVNYFANDCKNVNISTTISITVNPTFLIDVKPIFYHKVYNENLAVYEEIESTSFLEKETVYYKIIGIYNDGSEKEIDYDCINFEIISSNNIELKTDLKSILIKNIEFPEMFVVNFSYSCNNIKFEKSNCLTVNPIKLQKIEIYTNELDDNKFYATPDEEKLIYAKAIYSDNSKFDVGEKCEIRLAAGNPDLIKSIDKNKIIFNKSEYKEENIALLVSYIDEDFPSEARFDFIVITILSK